MFDLDLKTLFVFSAILTVFIMVLYIIYIRFYNVKNQVINIFIIAKFISLLMLLLVSSRDKIPLTITIVLTNTLYIFATFYEIYCVSYIDEKFDLDKFKKLNLIPLFLISIFYFFLNSTESTRIIVISLSLFLMYLLAAYFLITEKRKTKIQYLSGYLFLIAALFLLVRSIGAIINPDFKVYSTNYIQISSNIFLILLNFIIPVLLFFILKEKDNEIMDRDIIRLKKLNNSKNKFFSIIAHDLKGPLGSLQQVGELLWLNKNIPQETRDKLTESLYNSSKNTFNLLDNLLKWANANSGQINYKPNQVNLLEIIKNNIQLYKSQVDSKHINLSCTIETDLMIYADYDMIDTVIRNLISNAIKFTPNNGIIDVKLNEFNISNNACSLSIVDTGIGMNAKLISTIFDLEESISTLGTNNEKGTGLGLKLCNEFLKINNGKIRVESVINEGTSVYITLPIQEL